MSTPELTTPSTQTADTADVAAEAPWWVDAVIYQVYPRSFADADGDGMGDLAGVTARLPYLQQLGVDAVWLSPFYVSPQRDAGYDVTDYRDVDPRFGTLADADELIAAAHEAGTRVIVDLVPNHTSSAHQWFGEALAAGPGSPERDRYIFRPGSGPDGALPPNNWTSTFGGPAWTRAQDAPGASGAKTTDDEWYLHLFDASQPDLNWDNAEVREEFENILRFWLDRGADGFRVDVAHGLVKAEGLPDYQGRPGMVSDAAGSGGQITEEHRESFVPPMPFHDQEGVHEIYRRWNEVLTEYDHDPVLVAEAWVAPLFRLFRYVRPGEMHQAFNFTFLMAGWDAQRMAAAIDASGQEARRVGAPNTWVLSNHDTVRHSSRFGQSDPTAYPNGIAAQDEQPDEALGWARGRAAALIELGLPGSAYIYQGDELGLPEHTTLDDALRQDPTFFRTEGLETGRDGCRIPMPWRAEAPGFGFAVGKAPADAEPWLPQPESFARYAADQQVGVESSTFELYRRLLRIRAELRLGAGAFDWAPQHDPEHGVLAFTVTAPAAGGADGAEAALPTVLVMANLGQAGVEIPGGHLAEVLSTDEALRDGRLAPDAAAWFRTA